MSTSPSPEIKQVKPHIYVGTALIMIVVFWAWWLLEHYTDLRVVRRGATAHSEPISYWFPTISTPIALIGSIVLWRRAAGIAANGIAVDAKIANFGASKSGMRDVTLSYSVNGKFYRVTKSLYETDLGDRKMGDTLPIVADKRTPKRFILNS